MNEPVRIEPLPLPAEPADVRGLAELLVATVQAGAAVSFVAPLAVADAEAWWQRQFAAWHPRAVCLVARDRGAIVGTVQLQPAWAPNQPHRAEVVKMMVRGDHQGRGLGARLMLGIEEQARRAGFRLLTLDTKTGSVAERLYRRLGWVEVGVVPDFAVDPDGVTLHGTTIFYRRLRTET